MTTEPGGPEVGEILILAAGTWWLVATLPTNPVTVASTVFVDGIAELRGTLTVAEIFPELSGATLATVVPP